MRRYTRLIIDNPAKLDHPTVARFTQIPDGHVTLSTDYSPSRTVKAAGETIERMLSSCRVTAHKDVKQCRVSDLHPVIRQWAATNMALNDTNQMFDCVPVAVSNVDEPVLAPEVLFRLDGHPDDRFYQIGILAEQQSI